MKYALFERVSTGIPGLDELMEGGFPKGSIIIYSGPTGSGKTTAAIQFVYEGAHNGEKCLYISLEENKDNLMNLLNMISIEEELIDKNLFIIDAGHIRSHMCGYEEEKVGGILNFEALKALINLFVDTYGISRIAIDCLTAIGFRYSNPLTFRSDLFSFAEYLKKKKLTSVLLTEVEEGSNKISRFDVEEFIADGVIKLGFDIMHHMFQRYLLIRKMRFTNHSIRMYAINISDKGIVVEGELMS